jgi:hypothetical protein
MSLLSDLATADQLAAAQAQYESSADWYGSRATAVLRLQAIGWFLTHHQSMSVAGRSLSYDLNSLSKEQEQIQAYLDASSTIRQSAARSFVRGRPI